MRVEPLLPDAPVSSQSSFDEVYPERGRGAQGDKEGIGAFAHALDAIGATLAGATGAEDAFAYGRGTLEAAVYERAQADVVLSVATATAQRIAQAVGSVLNMQV